MDYSKIRLNNERNSHVVKRRNRLGAWGFFKVLYRDNLWRLFGFSLLMLLLVVPVYFVSYAGQRAISQVYQSLPMQNVFGFSTGYWGGVNDYYQQLVFDTNVNYGLMMVGASLILFVVFSGGFAVIRDAFWTGKLSTVGVFKSLGLGLSANTPYAFVSTVVLAFSVYGTYTFYAWLSQIIAWLAIVLTIIIGIVVLLLACYLMILCSVSVTYKQSPAENLDDAWRLLWMNVLPNVLHLLIAIIPVALMLFFPTTSMFYTLLLVLIFMFGGMYFPLVWQSFMMKTFALFHPVEVKKKKEVMRELREKEDAERAARQEAERVAAERREARKHKNKQNHVAVTEVVEEQNESAEESSEIEE